VIALLDVLVDKDYYYLVLPYLRHGDLFDYVKRLDGGGGLPVSEARQYFSQVGEGGDRQEGRGVTVA